MDDTFESTTLGVEEEFLIVDPQTCQVVARADDVLAGVPPQLRTHIKPEVHQSQIEIASPVCTDLTETYRWLADLRGQAIAAAEAVGCRLIAAGAAVLAAAGTPPISAGERYRRMDSEFGALLTLQGLCAAHVHVGVADRGLATQVSNWLRPHLPVLQAISANSPFADGRDTGYASWRSMQWSRWPTAGPPAYWHSSAHYDLTVDALIEAGLMLDAGMTYWHARLSPRYPTIEIRVGDVCATIDETILLAGLARALVSTAVHDIRAGRPIPDFDEQSLRAAHFRAARDGLEGRAYDPVARTLRPFWEVLEELVALLAPALDRHDDQPRVRQLLAGLRERGTGAARQRAIAAGGAGLEDVVRFLIAETARPAATPDDDRRGTG